ncbi:hypothetical protein [Nocardioides sp. Root151]|uniref:hypothetical protein n=1 Tax=Nocardioides sp. Root151 TaxID=1736475 RepID=UPI001F1A6AD9|nr:hypothetical protein [Nocardioides sp. Root151]
MATVMAGCGGDDPNSASETATVTVTVTEPAGDDNGAELDPAEQGEPSGDSEPVLERAGDTVVLGPDDEGTSVAVTLNKVTYPKPKSDDTVSPERVFVAVEMTIRHLSGPDAYGTNVYPNFESADGQLITDTGWAIAMLGAYGTGEFSEELPDSVGPGQFLKGWSLYEIPAEAGALIFPHGPSGFRITVDPTKG